MKIIDIAMNDLRRSSRSAFALVFMFGVPLLVTGMFYLMFSGLGSNEGFSLPQTKVVIANLDEGNPLLQSSQAQPAENAEMHSGSIGAQLTGHLKSEGFTDLMEVSEVETAEEARQAVDSQQAGLAIIFPADLSHDITDPGASSTVEIYHDPTLTLGPAIVRSILGQFMDSISGVKIAVSVALAHQNSRDPALISQVMQAYDNISSQTSLNPASWVVVGQSQSPEKRTNPMLQIIGPIFGGMMVFYAFYTGTATAQSILREEEQGTLSRLFTTPTPQPAILSGKFLAVFLITTIQVVVLLLFGHFIFKIDFGSLWVVLLLVLAIVLPAATFGIFVNSVTKSTRQSGVVFGAVLTLTGMIGLIRIFTLAGGENPSLRTVSLLTPQGWSVDQLLLSMNGSAVQQVLLPLLVAILWSVVFFSIGVWRFQKRYA